jgi:hypothetical protein
MSVTVSGVFAYRNSVLDAIRRTHEAGLRVYEVMTPAPDHEIVADARHRPTAVGWFTLAGGTFGVLLGFFGATYCHEVYKQIAGGKPVVSVPPFIIVAFEMLILFGGLMTLAGIIVLARLPHFRPSPHYDPRVSEDHYVVVVEAPEDKAALAGDILRQAGGEVGKIGDR